MIRKSSRGLRAALGLGVLGLSWIAIAGPAIGADDLEFVCEEAVAHLNDCCPGFQPSKVQCNYTYGCDDTSGNPEISSEQNDCLQKLSCEQLVKNGDCKAAQDGGAIQCQ
jgi:hypothetical protein